jgi:Signal transduction histidine kinase regulating C4-dicarboxylate transport system
VGLFQSQQITKNFEINIDDIVTYINFNKTRKIAIILFLTNLVFLFIDYINKMKGLWFITDGYKYLFFSHVILGLVTLLYILLSYRKKVSSVEDITLYHKLYVIVFAFFVLSHTAVISGWIDQKIHGQITVYIMGCFLIAIMYICKPKVTALLYVLSHVAFMVFLFISQKDPVIRQGHYINASLLVVIAYFLSIVHYQLKQQDLMYKHYLEDLVKERTMDLETANDLLTREIYDRKQAEAEMARFDRLKLIGEMAASISHEVRNPMTTVKGFLQLLKHKQETGDKEYFDLMIEELDRANSILSEFLSISRTKPTMLELHNINDIVTSTLPLVQADVLNTEHLLTVELNSVPDLQLNLQEIRQLLLNLVRNGLEAMSCGGQLRIKTFSTAGEVALVVSDEGHGIPGNILEKLGQPFNTTKEQGTGLGLAVCYGIVARHNGRIEVETSSLGSTFNVFFAL